MSRSGLLLVAASLAAVPRATAATLTLYHTNDTQGHLQAETGGDEHGQPKGGMARVLHVLAEARRRGEDPVVVDGGDVLGAALLSEFDAGSLMTQLMTEAGYDAVVAGNHEFDYGLDTLRSRAAQAGFPFLGANVRVGDVALLASWQVVERRGLRVGLVGLMSPQQSTVINRRRNPGLTIGDPAAALESALQELEGRADLFVGLVHMPMAEVTALAGRFPQVPLWVVGSGAAASGSAVPHHLQLASGVHIVTTPGGTRWVGRVALDVERGVGGPLRVVDIDARLLALTADQTAQHPEAAARVEGQLERFERARSEVLATVVEPIADEGLLLADVVRTRAGAEVCVINRGALRDHDLAGAVTRADVDRLIRYEDTIVLVDLSGADLKGMATSSSRREQAGQRLVFSGLDTLAGRVDGRDLVGDELYRVATTGYLADGGDGYLTGGPGQGRAPRPLGGDSPLSLGRALSEHLLAHPALGPSVGIAANTGSAWKSQAKLSGSLSRSGVTAVARRYSGVSFLGGSDAMAWNTLLDGRATRETARGTLGLNVRSTFGQVREDSGVREAADRLQTEWIYTWQRPRPAPFVSADANTVWTAPRAAQRPLTLRASAGLQRSLGRFAKARVGLGLERDVVAGVNEVGLEVVPEYQRRFGKGNSFGSNLKAFVGATRTRKVSAQQYNNLLINLVGDLYVTIDANFFLHRDDKGARDADGVALKSELQVGVGYAFRGKWI